MINFLSSTTNVILHPLNTHFSRLIPRPVSTLFSQQRSDYLRSYLNNSISSPTGISKHSKTINKNTRPCASCFHTLFSRVWISRWNTRSRCSNITSTLAKGFIDIIFWSCVYTLRLIGPISYPGQCDLMVHTQKYSGIFSRIHFVNPRMLTCINIPNRAD